MSDHTQAFLLRHWWLPAAIGAIFVIIVLISSQVAAQSPDHSEGRMVTIYDRGTEHVVFTKGDTVADALEKAEVDVSSADTVEPELDTELVANNYHVNVYRARPVTVIEGEVRFTVMTAAQDPAEIAEAADMKLYPEDETEITRADDLLENGGAGLTMSIDRATPLTLVLYGEKTKVRTHATTVGEFLDEKDIQLQDNDTLSVKRDASIKAGMQVEVWRNGTQTVTEERPVDYEVEEIEDADREVGYREVKTPGEKGREKVTFEVEMKNGKEISRKEIQKVRIEEPKKEVVIVGTKPTFDGEFADALAELRACEGSYDSYNPAGPYWGAYQFGEGTWNAHAPEGAEYGSASPAEQDQAARNLYEARGWQPWPVCGANLPDTFR